MVDEASTPISIDEGLARFLLDVKEKIDDLDHDLAGQERTSDDPPTWEKVEIGKDEKGLPIYQKPIMEVETRKKFISNIRDFCSRIFTMSYYPEYNDIMRVVREARMDIGDFLVEGWYRKKIRCEKSYLRILRDRPVRMIESSLLCAFMGGMRNAMRQSMRSTEVIRPREKEKKGSRFPNIFG